MPRERRGAYPFSTTGSGASPPPRPILHKIQWLIRIFLQISLLPQNCRSGLAARVKGISQILRASHPPCRLRPLAALLGAALALSQSGCALHYHDAKTGTEHVWGLTHVKMRVAPATGSPAPSLATQSETVGIGLHLGSGAAAAGSGLVLGWDRRTRVVLPEDGAMSLEWPSTQLFDVRVGRLPPSLPADPPLPAASVSAPPSAHSDTPASQ